VCVERVSGRERVGLSLGVKFYPHTHISVLSFLFPISLNVRAVNVDRKRIGKLWTRERNIRLLF